MINRDRRREIKKYLDEDGWETGYDLDGHLVAERDYVRRVYDKDGRGGYHEISGPTGVYVDEFGNI